MINLDRYAATYGEKYGEHIEWLREVASAVKWNTCRPFSQTVASFRCTA